MNPNFEMPIGPFQPKPKQETTADSAPQEKKRVEDMTYDEKIDAFRELIEELRQLATGKLDEKMKPEARKARVNELVDQLPAFLTQEKKPDSSPETAMNQAA